VRFTTLILAIVILLLSVPAIVAADPDIVRLRNSL
jgi:hypothetical protein